MGLDALNANGITKKIYYLIRDRAAMSSKEPLRRVRRSRLLLFVAIHLLGFGATMAITQTIGTFDLFFYLLAQNSPTDYGVTSCDWISNRHLAAHTFTHSNRPETPVYGGGIGRP